MTAPISCLVSPEELLEHALSVGYLELKSDEIQYAGIRAELVFALCVAGGVYAEYEAACVITSLNDSNHSHTSLHYAGAAADLRTRHLSMDANILVRKIDMRLGRDYDVLFEGDHIHIEWQPRRPLH